MLDNAYDACSPGRELRGLGIANLFGAAFNCYTTTGSFSRSAVMDQTGAKTQVAAYVTVSGHHTTNSHTKYFVTPRPCLG